MLDQGTVLRHYKREDVQEEMIVHSKDKEVVGSFGGKGYSKRPDVLSYPRDILELAKQGITSFHASEEIWSSPLRLDPMLKRQEMEDLRIGWDLVIDIDCPYFPYSKIAADLIIKALKHHNINAVSVKFSGNKGFHIGVPFESFPKTMADKETSKRFPDSTREVALYLKSMVQEIFASRILKMEDGDISRVAENLKRKKEEILKGKKIDSDAALDIDTILISPRHLYRMPYSLHEKSGLCSIPVDPEKVMEFQREYASPEKVGVDTSLRFLDREKCIKDEAKELFDRAIAEGMNKKEKTEFAVKEKKPIEIPENAIPERFFPPCIQNILKGITDGKKRSMFILMNFLTSVGWSHEEIEKKMKEWNEKNPEPLREVLLVGHLRYNKQKKKKVLPPNCQNQMYYKDFNVCHPDNLCSKIKNPVQYSKRKTYYLHNQKDKKGKEKGQKDKENKPTDKVQK